MRDGGDTYMGKGCATAVKNINTVIGPALVGKAPVDQKGLDDLMVKELDGTTNEWGYCKKKLGANAILAVSMAICKAGAGAKGVPLYQHIADLAGNRQLVLPVPAFNIINGGSPPSLSCSSSHRLGLSVTKGLGLHDDGGGGGARGRVRPRGPGRRGRRARALPGPSRARRRGRRRRAPAAAAPSRWWRGACSLSCSSSGA